MVGNVRKLTNRLFDYRRVLCLLELATLNNHHEQLIRPLPFCLSELATMACTLEHHWSTLIIGCGIVSGLLAIVLSFGHLFLYNKRLTPQDALEAFLSSSSTARRY
jgi:hypothetical protein